MRHLGLHDQTSRFLRLMVIIRKQPRNATELSMQAISEIEAKLSENRIGHVWIPFWSERYGVLGGFEKFVSSRPDKFVIHKDFGSKKFKLELARPVQVKRQPPQPPSPPSWCKHARRGHCARRGVHPSFAVDV